MFSIVVELLLEMPRSQIRVPDLSPGATTSVLPNVEDPMMPPRGEPDGFLD